MSPFSFWGFMVVRGSCGCVNGKCVQWMLASDEVGEECEAVYGLPDPHMPSPESELLAALKAMCAEFRALDLPYGSEAYSEANRVINKAYQRGLR